MDEANVRSRIAEHFAAIGVDQDLAGRIYADDAELVYVQSGERIKGRSRIIGSRQDYPGPPARFTLDRLVGSGDLWVAELTLLFDGANPHTVAAVLEFQDGFVVSERIFVAEPWDPPEYRARYVTAAD